MTKFMRIVVQTITTKTATAPDNMIVGALSAEDMAEVKGVVDEEARNKSEPGMAVTCEVLSAEIIEVP